MAMEDRYHAGFSRPDHRFHDFDHCDRGQYEDHTADRSGPASCHSAHDLVPVWHGCSCGLESCYFRSSNRLQKGGPVATLGSAKSLHR
jgi:hypothetical protein